MKMVTGAFGFIGSHLVESLLSTGEGVLAVGHPSIGESYLEDLRRHQNAKNMVPILMDLRSHDHVISVVKHYRPSTIFHLGALASHRLSLLEPHAYLENNVITVLNVLEAARVCEPSPRVLFASSSSIYGDHKPPLREDLPPRPKGPYALSKWIGEEISKEYARDYGLDVVMTRYFNVVGERCRSNIVFKIFADKIYEGRPVEVNGKTVNGVFKPATRDFTYVGDVVSGTILTTERGARGEVYNIGRGAPVSVEDLAVEMMKALGRRVEVIRRELAPHESHESYSDNSKARAQLGWSPEVGFEETVKRYANWYLSQRIKTKS